MQYNLLTANTKGYWYHFGTIELIEGEHANVNDKISSGWVRIRKHVHIVSFQGRSKRCVKSAFKKYCDNIGVPVKYLSLIHISEPTRPY